ncbi:MAG: hypothetical protein KIS76_05510 [Pyrinomonadaceae bacterium]|nr:hypothetical protein [Pyrinomonadaceae bacterium]
MPNAKAETRPLGSVPNAKAETRPLRSVPNAKAETRPLGSVRNSRIREVFEKPLIATGLPCLGTFERATMARSLAVGFQPYINGGTLPGGRVSAFCDLLFVFRIKF